MNLTQKEIVWHTIDSAISTQRVIQIKLNKTWRTIEPYQLGYPKGGQRTLTVYGYCRDIVPDACTPSRWQWINLDNIDAIELTYYYFQPQAEYTGATDHMQTVFCQLSAFEKPAKKRSKRMATLQD